MYMMLLTIKYTSTIYTLYSYENKYEKQKRYAHSFFPDPATLQRFKIENSVYMYNTI